MNLDDVVEKRDRVFFRLGYYTVTHTYPFSGWTLTKFYKEIKDPVHSFGNKFFNEHNKRQEYYDHHEFRILKK